VNKFIMFFELFFCSFRTLNFSGSINRIDNHILFLFCIRKIFVAICNRFFHRNLPFFECKKYNILNIITRNTF